MRPFVGRHEELCLLKNLHHSSANKGKASLVVIKGRRRVGKSRLAEEFAKDKRLIRFSGMPPTNGISAKNQLDHFAAQFVSNFKVPPISFTDWNFALSNLEFQITKKHTILLLDEISWMGSKDPTFIPKLKEWWDQISNKFPNLTMIFCGSISTWINDNIINSTAFFGRISLIIDLPPLSIPESAEFLQKIKFKGSSYDIYKILSVTGGIPWYLEQIDQSQLADENLQRMCFHKNGILTTEFDRLFYDLFLNRSDSYKSIIKELSKGMRTPAEIKSAISYTGGGSFSEMLQNLVTSGFITRHNQWSFKTRKLTKTSLYRLSDNYVRFYLKYIEPNLPKIQKGNLNDINIAHLPGWESMMGHQVENLLLQNRSLLLKFLRIESAEIVADNPYIQTKTQRQKGCQIDYLIQTHSNNLIACEFKFKRTKIGTEIIDEVKEKLNRFSKPKNMAIVPALIYFGDLSNRVIDSDFFYRLINISELLEY